MENEKNRKIPHQAIVVIQVLGEVHELLPNGQTNPKVVAKDRGSTLYECRADNANQIMVDLADFKKYILEKINEEIQAYRKSHKGHSGGHLPTEEEANSSGGDA